MMATWFALERIDGPEDRLVRWWLRVSAHRGRRRGIRLGWSRWGTRSLVVPTWPLLWPSRPNAD